MDVTSKCMIKPVGLIFTMLLVFSSVFSYAIDPPTLSFPNNHSVNLNPKAVGMKCNFGSGGYTIRYQISEEADFSTILSDTILGYFQTFGVYKLHLNRKYYWRAKHYNNDNTDSSTWTPTFDFSTVDHEGMTYDQIIVFMDFNARAAETVNYFDNITFNAGGGGGSGDDAPMVAAPNPTVPEADVISMFSDAYTDVAVNTWRTDWSSATLSDIDIDGNATKKYTNMDVVGIETTGDNSLDITEMKYLNFDFWTPNSTTMKVKLVDFGANNEYQGGDDVEHELIFDSPTQKEWVSQKIELTDFTGLTTMANISQMILVSAPGGSSTVYVDNVYFSKEQTSSIGSQKVVSFKAYPNPTTGLVTLPSNTKTYSVTTLTGQQVMTGTNVLDMTTLVKGIYTVNITLQDGTTAYSKISKH